jgi:predicted enzyme related to lactoylglutathione lyase
MAGIAKIESITIDVKDLLKELEFWEAVLGAESEVWQHNADFVTIKGSNLALQKVPELKSGKNRAHPDMAVEDIDAATPQLEALGASVVQPPPTEGFRWAVMADPEGNEFCISAG